MIMVCVIHSASLQEAAASVLHESSPAGLLFAWLSSVQLQGHVCPDVCKRITQLFVCFHLPYKQFGLFLGKSNAGRANTHALSIYINALPGHQAKPCFF